MDILSNKDKCYNIVKVRSVLLKIVKFIRKITLQYAKNVKKDTFWQTKTLNVYGRLETLPIVLILIMIPH